MAAFLFSTACTSTKTLTHQPDNLQNVVRKGDFVKITTKDGDKIELRIVELTSEAIRGNKTEQGHSRRKSSFLNYGKIATQLELHAYTPHFF